MSADANKDMTYGEFVQRRAYINGKIRAAEQAFARATDYRYTPLTTNGGMIAQYAIDAAKEELRRLMATWQDIQRTKRSEP